MVVVEGNNIKGEEEDEENWREEETCFRVRSEEEGRLGDDRNDYDDDDEV